MKTTESKSLLDKYNDMSLEELEQAIISSWNGASRWDKIDLGPCLFHRKHIINNDHPITKRELVELKRVNRLLTKHTFRISAEVEELFEKLKSDVLLNYNEITVRAELYPSDDDRDENSNFEDMDDILFDEAFSDPSKYFFNISLSYNRATGEEHTKYMCFYDEDTKMWDDLFFFTFRDAIEEKDAFEVYYPMHALYDHSPYSRQDIIRISDFKAEITVTFE